MEEEEMAPLAAMSPTTSRATVGVLPMPKYCFIVMVSAANSIAFVCEAITNLFGALMVSRWMGAGTAPLQNLNAPMEMECCAFKLFTNTFPEKEILESGLVLHCEAFIESTRELRFEI